MAAAAKCPLGNVQLHRGARRTKRNYEVSFRMVGGYVLKTGKRLGAIGLAAKTRRS
jgi:hypothetical protein